MVLVVVIVCLAMRCSEPMGTLPAQTVRVGRLLLAVVSSQYFVHSSSPTSAAVVVSAFRIHSFVTSERESLIHTKQKKIGPLSNCLKRPPTADAHNFTTWANFLLCEILAPAARTRDPRGQPPSSFPLYRSTLDYLPRVKNVPLTSSHGMILQYLSPRWRIR